MILLTGANGFIGSYLLKKLINVYGKEHVLALTSTPIEGVNYLLHNDYSFDNDYFLKAGYESINTIVHAGAFTPKSSLEKNDKVRSTSNVINTQKLLSADLPSITNIIYLSTLDVYEYTEVINEDSSVAPSSLYAQSKWDCEKLITEWAIKQECTHQILRIGHVYGPGEECYRKVITETMKRVLDNKPVELYGKGNEIRTFIYIDDVIDSIIKIMRIDHFIGPVNIVGDEKITIQDLIAKIIEISGIRVEVKRIDTSFESKDYLFDNKKLRSINATPFVRMNEGLTNEWLHMKQQYEAGIL